MDYIFWFISKVIRFLNSLRLFCGNGFIIDVEKSSLDYLLFELKERIFIVFDTIYKREYLLYMVNPRLQCKKIVLLELI